MVVLDGELEVGERDGDERRHDGEDAKDDKEDAIQRVQLVAPNGGEDVVQLDRDGAVR